MSKQQKFQSLYQIFEYRYHQVKKDNKLNTTAIEELGSNNNDVKQYSYQQMFDDIDKAATDLLSNNNSDNNTKIYAASNCYETVILDLAISKLGLTAVPVFPDASDVQISQIEKFVKNYELNRHKSTSRESSQCILFTPGTVSQHEPVVLELETIIANITNFAQVVKDDQIIRTDIYLSVLPLSHIMPKNMIYVALLLGSKICLCNQIKKIQKAFEVFSPTYTLLVPKIIENIYAQLQIHEPNVVLKSLLKRYAHQKIANNVTNYFGGNMSCCFSGGQTLNDQMFEYFNSYKIPCESIYTITQAGGAVCMNSPSSTRRETVGTPLPHIKLQISDQNEIVLNNYFGTDLITGDLGEKDSDGFVKIIGRNREIIVTSAGRAVSPEPIQKDLTSDPLIGEAIIIGEKRPYLSALIAIDVYEAEVKLSDCGIDIDSIEAKAYLDKHVSKVISKINQKLSNPEQIKKYVIIEDGFDNDEDIVADNMQLRRNEVCKRYKSIINSYLYN